LERPDVIKGSTRKIKTGCGNLYVTINANEKGELYEAFVRLGKTGGCAASQSEAMGRLLTMLLRLKAPLDEIVKQMRGIACHQPYGLGQSKVSSCADALGKALQLHHRKEGHKTHEMKADPGEPPVSTLPVGERDRPTQGACPDCGGPIRMEEGCKKCVCGWTEC